ncbi:MAG: DUF389 domain-containing protein [Acidimicrobiales bacterium]|nr:DUF389 domain-containing protein [Acidimicrobiales bacterium]
MIHIRAVSPPDVTSTLEASLSRRPGVLNLIVLVGAARHPDGDAVQFDVTNAEANEVLAEMRRLDVARRGSIVIGGVDTELSDRAAEAEAEAPPTLVLSPVWEQAKARIRAGGRYPPSWFVLLTCAGLIAAVGILTNSQILIVGAMVVGPEYSAIISVALGIDERDGRRVRAGATALSLGFLVAIVVTLAFSLVVRARGLEPDAFRLGIRPVSNLIDTPNVLSVVVTTLAGIVGVVSLAEARPGALIGVFISVTTIPAAADVGVSAAYEEWGDASGSLVQLVLNVTILMVVGAIGLVVQQRAWRRIGRRQRG